MAEPNTGISREELPLRRMQVDGHTQNAAVEDVSARLLDMRSILPTLDPKAGPDSLRSGLLASSQRTPCSNRLTVRVVPNRARRLRNPCHEHAVFAWCVAMVIAQLAHHSILPPRNPVRDAANPPPDCQTLRRARAEELAPAFSNCRFSAAVFAGQVL